MKRYNSRFIFYITKDLKRKLKKRAKELDIPMSDYLRTLIKQDIKINEVMDNNINNQKNIHDIELFSNKLSGYYKGLR